MFLAYGQHPDLFSVNLFVSRKTHVDQTSSPSSYSEASCSSSSGSSPFKLILENLRSKTAFHRWFSSPFSSHVVCHNTNHAGVYTIRPEGWGNIGHFRTAMCIVWPAGTLVLGGQTICTNWSGNKRYSSYYRGIWANPTLRRESLRVRMTP